MADPTNAQLADAIDRINGTLAGLIAFVGATGTPLPAGAILEVQKNLPQMTMNRWGTDPNSHPLKAARETFDRLQRARTDRIG
jgi:hypothetical protein